MRKNDSFGTSEGWSTEFKRKGGEKNSIGIRLGFRVSDRKGKGVGEGR